MTRMLYEEKDGKRNFLHVKPEITMFDVTRVAYKEDRIVDRLFIFFDDGQVMSLVMFKCGDLGNEDREEIELVNVTSEDGIGDRLCLRPYEEKHRSFDERL